jgi:hypothetical protein
MAFFNRPDDKLNEEEGHVEFVSTTAGIHSICFDNTMSRWTAKVVSFVVENGSADKAAGGKHAEIAKLEHLGPTVDSVIKIADELDSIAKLQHHMRVRERSHHDHVATASSRVQWMTIFESALLVGLAVFQIRYIQTWFSEKRKLRV